MNHFFHLEGVIAALTILGMGWAFLKALYHVVRRVDDNFRFIESLRENHLPHIQACLEMIATKLEIGLPKQ